jgi:predicted nucleic acid-binding protein
VPTGEDRWLAGKALNSFLLVTDNARDFERIKPFCNVRLRRGSEYFSS